MHSRFCVCCAVLCFNFADMACGEEFPNAATMQHLTNLLKAKGVDEGFAVPLVKNGWPLESLLGLEVIDPLIEKLQDKESKGNKKNPHKVSVTIVLQYPERFSYLTPEREDLLTEKMRHIIQKFPIQHPRAIVVATRSVIASDGSLVQRTLSACVEFHELGNSTAKSNRSVCWKPVLSSEGMKP